MTVSTLLDTRGWLVERTRGTMQPGSVLLHAPSHVFQAPGGGEHQLVQTGRHLEERGVLVRPFCAWADSIRDARVLHLFGMSREGLELAKVARATGVPVVLSPICWYEPKAIAALAEGPLEAVRGLTAWATRRAFPRWPGWRRRLLRLADAVLPNSRAEVDQLVALFEVDAHAIRVVPNGVDPRFADASPVLFREHYGSQNFVLYVGRIEPRKNVLALVEATRESRLPLVAIGDAPPGRRAYYRACRAAGGEWVRWLGGLEHEDPMLASAYAACRVFALPSWFETPGLAALEAALAGRPLVVTPYGCTREYFGASVEYARPNDAGELAGALRKAWERRGEPNEALARRVGSLFLWSDVARRTAEVYDQVAG
jgi:hypothetical protein